MQKLVLPWTASQVVGAILIFGLLFVLGANLPGHLSYDSLAQLSEGRSGLRETWGPATYAWILGVFDEIVPGTGLYVVASSALLFGSLLALRALQPTVSWWAAPVAGLFVLSPLILIYQGIVWKDVLFANLAVTGFVCLAGASVSWNQPTKRWLALAGALLCLAFAALVRQNGVIAILIAALALGALRFGGGWRQALAWSAGSLITALVVMQVLGAATQIKTQGPVKPDVGIRILQHYDILGAVARDPNYPLAEINKTNPASVARIRAVAAGVYSPERVDFFDRDPTLGPALWSIPRASVAAEWRDLVTRHPDIYLAQRADVFRWVFLTPRIEACLPQYVGVGGPEALVAKLGLTNAIDPADQSLANYATYFYGTPVYSHLAYAVLALIVAGVLLWRRRGGDLAIAGLLLAGLAFAASFFVISIACDYRYLYFLDLAAMTGVFYFVLDPSLTRRPVGPALRSTTV